MESRLRWAVSFVKSGQVPDRDDLNESLGIKQTRSMVLPVHSEYSDLEDSANDENLEQDVDNNTAMTMDHDSSSEMYENENVSMADSGEDLDDIDSEESVSSSLDSSTILRHKKRHPVLPPDDLNASKIYEQYGIGALLMKRMGYEEGKGIGSGQSGIVDPLNANPNKGRLGVGAKGSLQLRKEKGAKLRSFDDHDVLASRRYGNRSVSSGQEDYASKPSELEVLTFNIYKLTTDFGDLGVDIPAHLRDWAFSLKSLATDKDIDRLRYKYGYLEDIWYEISLLNEEEENLNDQLKYADNDAFITAQYEELLSIAKQSEEAKKDEHIEEVLELLLKFPLTDDLVKSLVLTISKPKIDLLTSIPLDDYDQQQAVVVPALNRYTTILNPQYAMLNDFYEYLLDCFELKFQQLLQSSDNIDKNLTTVASIWLDAGNSNLKDHVFHGIVRSVIVPYFDAQVNKWDFSPDTVPENLLTLLKILCVVGIDDDYSVGGAVEHLVSKVKSFLVFKNPSSFWHGFYDESVANAKLQITFIMQHLVPEFESCKKSTMQSIQETFKASFASWVESLTFIDVTPAMFDNILYLSLFLPQDTRFTFLQYLVFNNWIATIIRVYRANPHAIPNWYTTWYQFFTTKLKKESSKEIIDLIKWYLSKALAMIKSNFDPNVCKELPQREGERFPSAAQLLKPIGLLNVHGIPSYRLQMRFHDVVSDYCFTKNIQQKQLKRVVHNGFPILRFTKGGITRYGYIEDDVLWVGDSDDFNKCNYEPIAVDTLVDRF